MLIALENTFQLVGERQSPDQTCLATELLPQLALTAHDPSTEFLLVFSWPEQMDYLTLSVRHGQPREMAQFSDQLDTLRDLYRQFQISLELIPAGIRARRDSFRVAKVRATDHVQIFVRVDTDKPSFLEHGRAVDQAFEQQRGRPKHATSVVEKLSPNIEYDQNGLYLTAAMYGFALLPAPDAPAPAARPRQRNRLDLQTNAKEPIKSRHEARRDAAAIEVHLSPCRRSNPARGTLDSI